jgi:hypothetical protein
MPLQWLRESSARIWGFRATGEVIEVQDGEESTEEHQRQENDQSNFGESIAGWFARWYGVGAGRGFLFEKLNCHLFISKKIFD